MKAWLWRKVRSSFHRQFCEEVDRALLPVYRARVIDSGLLHLLDGRLKYRSESLDPGERWVARMPPPFVGEQGWLTGPGDGSAS